MLNLKCLLYLKVGFDDILGEPKETHSAECTWESSSECFLCWRGLTYRILTMFCGMCLSCVWGIKFAIIAFQHIWIITPLLRSWTIYLNCFQRYWGTCVACCLSPICEISSVIFSRIFVYRR